MIYLRQMGGGGYEMQDLWPISLGRAIGKNGIDSNILF